MFTHANPYNILIQSTMAMLNTESFHLTHAHSSACEFRVKMLKSAVFAVIFIESGRFYLNSFHFIAFHYKTAKGRAPSVLHNESVCVCARGWLTD